MSPARQRMIHPAALSDPGLQPIEKRLVYVAAMMLAEDSGCVLWSPRTLRHHALPFESQITDDEIAWVMAELEADDYAWTYKVDELECAYLPAFPEWQSSLTRWNVPRSVPLPPGIKYEEIESKQRFGSCRYYWPRTRAELLTQPSTHSGTPTSMQPFTQGPADSLRADSGQAAGGSERAKDTCPKCGQTLTAGECWNCG